MKANELRIGNYVQNEGRVIMVTHLANEDYWSGDDGDVEPIPLTPEWLERFGFECKESSSCKLWHIGINDVTHDYLFDLTWLIKPELINVPDFPFYKNGRHTIYSVHQLQNLYFALTGEELKID